MTINKVIAKVENSLYSKDGIHCFQSMSLQWSGNSVQASAIGFSHAEVVYTPSLKEFKALKANWPDSPIWIVNLNDWD